MTNPTIQKIEWQNSGDRSPAKIDKRPDSCPLCHFAIEPEQIFAFCDTTKSRDTKYYGQVVYRCPRNECHKFFVSYFSAKEGQFVWKYVDSQPCEQQKMKFNDSVKKVSSSFDEIYNEAYAAEQYGLNQICGVGYRKALEFLIKDYLINLKPNDEEAIKKKFLGNCIAEDITNQSIKDVAKRAVWLANDEAHYIRKWDQKDLTDLKRLIKLVVDWIEMEKLTAEVVTDMPDSN